jgi:predicted phage terminase large subunit-like protein
VVDDLIRQTASADGRQTLIREWQDPGQAGKSVIDSHTRLLAGYDYKAIRASGEKTMQWRPFLVQAEAGNVHVCQAPWTQAWLDEMALVPYALHNDQADSVALAFNELTAHKDRGPSVAVILPGAQYVGGPPIGSWREEYFRR